jgi:hypothetical protein
MEIRGAISEGSSRGSQRSGASVCGVRIVGVRIAGGGHRFDRGNELGRTLDIALGGPGVGGDRFVVALLAGFLGAAGEGVQILVEGAGSNEALVKRCQVPPWPRAYSSYSERAARAALSIA